MSKQKQRQNIATKLMNECTGVMKLINGGYYAGYYTQYELMQMMLAEGNGAKSVDFYVFSMKECCERHIDVVSVEETA